AFRLAVRHMTPVVVLSDSYLANSAEPWPIPDVKALGKERVPLRVDPEGFQPYARDAQTLARPWAIPGTPGLEHRIGGLSKQEGSGNVAYDPTNNMRMHALRHDKVARIADEIPAIEVLGPDRGDLIVVGWGGTRGAIVSACEEARRDGLPVSNIHLRHLNPFPADLGEVLSRFDKVLVAELNAGQLALLIRAEFLVDAQSLSKVEGQPFRVEEIRARIETALQEK
ncbi:MAG: 2-oxoglutarate ferredoxin oxidoreductase subunit alpha, partial [Myxococcota bacterium]|nr:2-oxoglutarate ferredoxin oxidoreductase subunit alpha [Myxococcota bacterium]